MPTSVKPTDRLNRVEFHPGEELENHEIHIGYYRCDRCDESLRLTTQDFQRHFLSKDSNLSAEDQKRFDDYRPLDRQQWEGFLDFYCQGCSGPVRIIFEPWEFRMSSYAFTVRAVVEATPAN